MRQPEDLVQPLVQEVHLVFQVPHPQVAEEVVRMVMEEMMVDPEVVEVVVVILQVEQEILHP